MFSTKSYVQLLLTIFTVASARNRSKECLPLFDSNRTAFTPCLKEPCLLFKAGPPIVDLGRQPHPPTQLPFRCSSRHSRFEHLTGVFFDFVDLVPELKESFCVYVENCSYNDLTKILSDAADAGDYQFIAGGGLFRVPYRITPFSSPSAAFFGGRMLVFGRRACVATQARQKVDAILSALGKDAWIVVAVVFGSLLLSRAWLVLQLGQRPRDFSKWYWAMWGVLEKLPEDASYQEREKRESLEFWLIRWRGITFVILAVVVLFFELGVVNFIFDQRNRQLDVPIKNRNMSQFAILTDSAEEYYFSILANLERKASSNSSNPWKSCNSSDEVFIKVREGSALFGVTHEHFGKFLLREQNACDEFVIYNTRDVTQEYLAVWYFGHAITSFQRFKINHRITTIFDNQRASGILRPSVPDEDDPCGMQPMSIGAIVLLPAIGPLALVLIFCLAGKLSCDGFKYFWQRWHYRASYRK